VEAVLRKYLWVLDLVVTALCAVFLARAAASAVESSLVIPPLRMPNRLARASTETVYSKEVEQILRRNVFCSTCPPIIDDPTKDTPTADNQPPQKTSLPLALLAVMYAPPPSDPRWSVAIIRDTEEKSTGPFAVDAKVHGATIKDIQETRIYIENSGKTEFLDLLDQNAAAAGAAAAAQPAAPTVASNQGDALSQELDRGIKKMGEHNYEIQRQTLESVLGNMNLLSRSARIVPEIRDGKAAGFRLYSVRPDGPFAKIGMQNGDVISAINGLEITSPEKALEVYAKLKSASHLSVGLERNGQKVTKDYSIR